MRAEVGGGGNWDHVCLNALWNLLHNTSRFILFDSFNFSGDCCLAVGGMGARDNFLKR